MIPSDCNKSILYIDDSQDNCELFNFILSREGYEVEVAGTIAQGIQVAQASPFDLYLVDLSLPDGTGFDLIQQIRQFDASTPVIVCSGDSRCSAQEATQQAGVQAFLLKPIDPTLLLQTVATILQNPALLRFPTMNGPV